MRMQRWISLAAGLAFLFAGLLVRLAWLQIRPALGTPGGLALVRQAVAQRNEAILLDEGRGRMTDRNGRPVAGIPSAALLVHPAEGATEEEAAEAARLLGERADRFRSFLAGLDGPVLWRRDGEREPAAPDGRQLEAIAAFGRPWLKAVPFRRRYLDPPAAAHLVGFVLPAKRTGAAGLERSFEPFLRPRSRVRLHFRRLATGETADGAGGRLAADGSRFYPLTLQTTLDLGIQRTVERLLAETGIADGAAVVLDVPTGDILAMASAPSYDPHFVRPEEGRWRNRALLAETPGSVFKTFIAAAALDAGVVRPGETFFCSGRHPATGLRCHARSGHGRITFEEAYAKSCNVAFAELALRLGAERLERAARRHGIGSPAGWRSARLVTPIGVFEPFAQLDGEEPGQLFARGGAAADPAAVTLAGIGQHSVRITPLQAAQWTAAVAAGGGPLPAPRAVSRICWNSGREMMRFPVQTLPGTGFSPSAARWLKRAMRLAAERGTASRLAGLPGGAGGKTGTAETGKGGLVHQWFTGYYPLERPRYAVAILVRNRPAGSPNLAVEAAGRLFRQLP